jgi:hypothetical protein
MLGYNEWDACTPIIARDVMMLLETMAFKGEALGGATFQGTSSYKEEVGFSSALTKAQLEMKSTGQLETLFRAYNVETPTSNLNAIRRDKSQYVVACMIKWGIITSQEVAQTATEIFRAKIDRAFGDKPTGAVLKVLLRTFMPCQNLSAGDINRMLVENDHKLMSIPALVVPTPKAKTPAPVKPPGQDWKGKDRTWQPGPGQKGNQKGNYWKDPRKGGKDYCTNVIVKGKCSFGNQCRYIHKVPQEVLDKFPMKPDGQRQGPTKTGEIEYPTQSEINNIVKQTEK